MSEVKEFQRKISRLQQRIKAEVDQVLKTEVPDRVKFTKVSLVPVERRIKLSVKIVLRQSKLPLPVLYKVVEILNKYCEELEVDAPHAQAIRLSGVVREL